MLSAGLRRGCSPKAMANKCETGGDVEGSVHLEVVQTQHLSTSLCHERWQMPITGVVRGRRICLDLALCTEISQTQSYGGDAGSEVQCA